MVRSSLIIESKPVFFRKGSKRKWGKYEERSDFGYTIKLLSLV